MTSRGRECSRELAGPTEYRPVKQTFIAHPDLLLHITFTGLDGREETLVTTAAHPFFTLEAQAFVDAQDLELGDVFRLASGDTAVVLDITHQRAPDGETFTTYNFEVEGSHTYFVGEQGVWVHNANSYLLCARLAAEYEKSLAKGMDAAKARSQAAEKLKRLRDQGTIKPDAYDKHLADLNKKLDGIDGKSAARGLDDAAAGKGRPSAKTVHDQFVQEVRPGAKEKVFETPWSQGKGLGSRKFDDFDFKTGTGFEGNTTPWSQMTQDQLSRKLDQVASDFALLKTNPFVKRIVWFGTEPLPTTGYGGQLREALQRAGIEYWVVKP